MKTYDKPKSDLILIEGCDILTTSPGAETPFIDVEEETSNGLFE